jgi:ferredoxin
VKFPAASARWKLLSEIEAREILQAAPARPGPPRQRKLARLKIAPSNRNRFLDRKEAPFMTHIVAQPCTGCKYTDCVVVCPVECFYEGADMLYIHPDECIDCEACVPECPVEAIFHEDNLPEEWASFKELNSEMATKTPVITEKKEPLADR